MSMKSRAYEITEQDIEAFMRFLKIYDPENANREWAIAILEHLQAKFHMMAHEDIETLKEMYEELKKKKRSIN